MTNILLKKFNTPFDTVPFEDIKPEDFLPAVKEGITMAKTRIAAIKENKEPESFENVVEALENAGPEVELISGVFFNLHSAETNDKIQEIAKEFSPLLTEYGNDISLDADLFKKIKRVWDHKSEFKLNAEQLMLLEKSYKSFVRNGALLNEIQKETMREISTKLSTLGLKFGDHILKETNDYVLVIENKDDLKGLPEDVIEAAATTAKEKGHEGKWVFTLQYPSVIPFLTYADNRELRRKLWLANSTKGFKDGETDNREIIKEIATLRHQKANLLGYESHAHFILEERMASTPKTVFEFMENIVNHATPAAVKETDEPEQIVAPVDTGGLGFRTVAVILADFKPIQVIPFSVISHFA